MAKAKWNFRTTGALIGELAARPVLRCLCGFKDAGDIPAESTFSRVFALFDADETVQKVFAKFIARTFDGALIHLAVADGDIPVAMWLTSASLHDSQVAIPLMQKAAGVCPSLYHLLDAAYDAAPIRDYSRTIGSVPIIPANPRRLGVGNAPEFEPDRAERFKNRSAVERVNSHLEDGHGGRSVYVRGHGKVFLHLAFGVLVIAVEQVLKLLE